MATNTFSYLWQGNQTNGIKLLHDALISVGLTQTSDTGQLSLATDPTFVATASYSYGYTVYQWTDAYQSTSPLYMRIEWKNSATSTVSNMMPFPVITVGTSTNGAGTINSTLTLVTPTTLAAGAATGDTLARNNYICYYDGALAIAIMPSSIGGSGSGRQQRQVYMIDRMRDLSNQKVGGASLTYSTGYNATLSLHVNSQQRYFSASRATGIIWSNLSSGQNTSAYSPYFMPYSWTAEQAGMSIAGDVPFFPPYILDPAARTWISEIAVNTADTPFDTNFTVTRFGQNYTYKSLAGNFPGPNYAMTDSTAKYGWAMIWQ